MEIKSGFVAVIGKPNAGKSTLINWILGEKILMVSHKANATRKRFLGVAMHGETQIVFVDTPGIHDSTKKLNQCMQSEMQKAKTDADVIVVTFDSRKAVKDAADFSEANPDLKVIVVLTKTDMITKDVLLERISQISGNPNFLEIVPTSSTKNVGLNELLNTIAKYLPVHPHYFDPEYLTPQTTKEIYAELIREAIFDNLSDELPYESDVQISKVEEGEKLDKIYAEIIVSKDSQKQMVIGVGGSTIKRIGKSARLKIEKFSEKKIYLELMAKTIKNWTTSDSALKNLGYEN